MSLAALLLVTPFAAALAFRLVHRGWRRVRAWLMGTTPPPWPGRRELAALAVAAAVVTGLGFIPSAGVRRELARPRRVEATDSLGYHVALETHELVGDSLPPDRHLSGP